MNGYKECVSREGGREKKTYGWRIWSCVAIDLVAAEDDKIGLFFIKHLGDEFECSRIGFAFSSCVPIWNWLATFADTIAKMQIADLHNFESTIILNSRLRLLALLWHTTTNSQMHAEKRASRIQQ